MRQTTAKAATVNQPLSLRNAFLLIKFLVSKIEKYFDQNYEVF
jgi:hypothetical protein